MSIKDKMSPGLYTINVTQNWLSKISGVAITDKNDRLVFEVNTDNPEYIHNAIAARALPEMLQLLEKFNKWYSDNCILITEGSSIDYIFKETNLLLKKLNEDQ